MYATHIRSLVYCLLSLSLSLFLSFSSFLFPFTFGTIRHVSLCQATHIATDMVLRYGMTEELGLAYRTQDDYNNVRVM